MNELTPQEIAEHLEKIHPKNALAMDTIYQLEALKEAATILRRVASGELRPVAHCGECKFRADFTDGHSECRRWPNIPMSYQRVDQNFDFCSYGERKDGAE